LPGVYIINGEYKKQRGCFTREAIGTLKDVGCE
jgi:hypothetical protein